MIKVYVLEPRDQGMIQCGFIRNHKGKIIRYGTKRNVYIPFISNVLLVEKLIHKLLSMSKLRGCGYDVLFNQNSYKTIIKKNGFVLFSGTRRNSIYKIKLCDLEKQKVKWLMSMN